MQTQRRVSAEKTTAAEQNKAIKDVKAKVARQNVARPKRPAKTPTKRKSGKRSRSPSDTEDSDDDGDFGGTPPRKKGKGKESVPVGGFGAKKVAVPGVSLEEIQQPAVQDSPPAAEASAPAAEASTIEPEKEKNPEVNFMKETIIRHLHKYNLDI